MLEKSAVDTSMKAVRTAEKGAEGLVKKAWSIMDAAGPKEKPSNYLSEVGIRAIQGRDGGSGGE